MGSSDFILFGVLFGMLSLILFNVLLLQKKADQIEKQSSKERRDRTNEEIDEGMK